MPLRGTGSACFPSSHEHILVLRCWVNSRHGRQRRRRRRRRRRGRLEPLPKWAHFFFREFTINRKLQCSYLRLTRQFVEYVGVRLHDRSWGLEAGFKTHLMSMNRFCRKLHSNRPHTYRSQTATRSRWWRLTRWLKRIERRFPPVRIFSNQHPTSKSRLGCSSNLS